MHIPLRHLRPFGIALLALCAVTACESRDGFSEAQWTVIRSLSPLPALPVNTTNRYRDVPAAAALGQQLFFDARISGPIPRPFSPSPRH